MAEIEMCNIASCGEKAEVWIRLSRSSGRRISGYIDVAIEALLIKKSISVCLCKKHAKQWKACETVGKLGEFTSLLRLP